MDGGGGLGEVMGEIGGVLGEAMASVRSTEVQLSSQYRSHVCVPKGG